MYPDIPVFALGILPPSREYELQLKGIEKRISQYNQILKDVFGCNFIDTSDIPKEGIMSDHHHLTAMGHQYVYEKIIQCLSEIENNLLSIQQ